MGTLVQPPSYGNDCADCWPTDETPEFIYITFSGVKAGDPVGSKQLANDTIFKCAQRDGFPCEWFYNFGGPGWQIGCWKLVGPIRFVVNAMFVGDAVYFDGMNVDCPSEGDLWSNNNWSPIWWKGWGGFATIFWMDTAMELVTDLVLPTDGKLLMEMFIKDETSIIYKFCNKKYSLNQSIEIL